MTIKDGSKRLLLPSAPQCMKTQAGLSSPLPHPDACLPGRLRYHACMHHGPANKLHRVATRLPSHSAVKWSHSSILRHPSCILPSIHSSPYPRTTPINPHICKPSRVGRCSRSSSSPAFISPSTSFHSRPLHNYPDCREETEV